MSTVPLLQEFQLAVFSVLSNAPALQTLVGQKIFDYVPESAQVPYVTMDGFFSTDAPLKDADGEDATCLIHVWVEDRSNLQLSTIVAAIKKVLNQVVLRMNNSVANNVRLHSTTIVKDRDGIHRQGVLRVTANLHEDIQS